MKTILSLTLFTNDIKVLAHPLCSPDLILLSYFLLLKINYMVTFLSNEIDFAIRDHFVSISQFNWLDALRKLRLQKHYRGILLTLNI